MVTWIYDETGCAGAILDEFCLRSRQGRPLGWVFGLSAFSLAGQHLGWFEDGVLYDIDNAVLGFVPDAGVPGLALPGIVAAGLLPELGKRPQVPMLRGRRARPARGGWSAHGLENYLLQATPLRTERRKRARMAPAAPARMAQHA
jgi:hypothetical protein